MSGIQQFFWVPGAGYTVISHLRGQGVPGTAVFTDEVAGRDWRIGFGSPVISASQSKFGTTSILSTSASGIQLFSSVADFKPDYDYTIEAWLYAINSSSIGTVIYLSEAFGFAKDLRIDICPGGTNNVIRHWCGSREISATSPVGSIFNRWVHVSACKKNTTIYVSVDGKVGFATGVVETAANPAGVYFNTLASSVSAPFQFINEFRMIKGACLYTSDFTPPTGPF